MIRDIFTNKWIIGGVGLLILGAIAFHILLERDMANFKRQVMQDRHAIQERARAAAEKQSTQEVAPAENGTPSAEKPITAPTEQVKKVPERQTETETPQQTALPAEKSDAAEVTVSAFGFGPFPEVPEGMTTSSGIPYEPIWEDPDYPNYELSRDMELIARVRIKKWEEEGDRGIVGASFQYGKVYLNYPNTVYVWYEEFEDDEGEGATLETSGPVSLRLEQIQRGEIPPGVRVIDGETGGIDPFEYLGLNP